MSLSSGSSSSGHSARVNRQPQGFYAYRHQSTGVDGDGMLEFTNTTPDDNSVEGEGGSGRKMGAVSVQNGAINLHIPCAFSYAYDIPVPPQVQPQLPTSRGRPGRSSKNFSGPNSNRLPTKTSVTQEDNRPFVTTVKCGELYKAKKLPKAVPASKSQNRTSVVWDMRAGEKICAQAVDYGQELYEQAAQNLAREMQEQQLAEKPDSPSTSMMFENCRDLSKPGFNHSRYTTKALEKAVESLKNLPEDMEVLLRKDKRFDPIVMSRATRSLNVGRNSKIYKELIPVDPNPDVRTEAENAIQMEIKRSIEAARQPSRLKDSEPKLQDFQKNTYTRIRPAHVPTPPKSSAGISIETNHDFDTILEEKVIEEESNVV